MNVALRHPGMTVADFLDWENRQEERWEFDGFAPVAMMGGTLAHNIICGNLLGALRPRLPAGCRVYVESVKLRLAHSVRYPDVMVVCGAMRPQATEVTDPTVVFEVLSPGTFHTDRIEKNREYAATASIQRYVLLEQDIIAAEVYVREAGRWVRATLTGDEALAMPELGITFPLAEAYAGLEFDSPAAAEAG